MAETTIYVVRHAWAGHHGDPRYPDDSQRPLTDEGRQRFAAMARKLVKRGCRPTLIATSPYLRCRQTAEILQQHVEGNPSVKPRDELAPASDLQRLLAWTAEQKCEQIAWVGHSPDVESMTAALIGDGRAQLHFAKGTAAAVSFAGRVGLGWGTLEWLVTAKLLGC